MCGLGLLRPLLLLRSLLRLPDELLPLLLELLLLLDRLLTLLELELRDLDRPRESPLAFPGPPTAGSCRTGLKLLPLTPG